MNVIELTQKLIQIESCNPGCYETQIGEYVYNYLKATGAEVSKQEVFKNRYNIIAKLPGESSEPDLVYVCHLDTVPIGESWDVDPLKAEIIDGKMYGRGSCDMKSGLASCLSAFSEISKKNKKLKRNFIMIASVDEEDCMEGVKKLIKEGIVTKNSWVLDAEPTTLQIQVAHKGKTWFNITAKGLAAHASTPLKGIDAVSAMGEFISSLNRQIKETPEHLELGACSATYGLINGGVNINVVPDSCTLAIDFRLVPPITNNDTIDMVKTAIKEAENKIENAKLSMEVTSSHPAVDRDDSSPLLKCLKKAAEEVQGKKPIVTFFPGYTDTAVIASKTGNINCMSFGPGDLGKAHKPNEYVDCKQVEESAAIVFKLAENVLY